MMTRQLLVLIGFLCQAGFHRVGAETPLNEVRSTLRKWVETRQLISKTQTDWQSDKEMLEQSILLFERELKSIEDQMTQLGTNSTQVDKERAQTDLQLQSANESRERTKLFAADFEARLPILAAQFPAPLREILKPFFARMPADPANTRTPATERMQTIVGVLNELDKFNNAVAVFSEKRQNAKGEEVAVETIYAGLGAAYFVNEAGDFAGTGAPGSNGWEWQIKTELARPVRDIIRIYRNEQPARFVSVPVTIK